MSCTKPISSSFFRNKIKDIAGNYIKVPCGVCPSCRADRIAQWSVRLNYEYLNKDSAFVTFTYDNNHLRYNKGYYEPTICRQDLHRYIDKIRHQLPKGVKFKYFACAEYGDRLNRPHFHVLFFGLDWMKFYKFFIDSWKFGSVDIKPLLNGGIRYVLKYLEKQQKGEFNDSCYYDNGLDCPFLSMSPGIGAEVFMAHMEELRNGLPIQYAGRSVVMPAYWRRKYLNLCKKSVDLMYKNYLDVRKSIFNKCVLYNFPDIRDKSSFYRDYSLSKAIEYLNNVKEENLISSMRKSGIPVYIGKKFRSDVVRLESWQVKAYVDYCNNEAL